MNNINIIPIMMYPIHSLHPLSNIKLSIVHIMHITRWTQKVANDGSSPTVIAWNKQARLGKINFSYVFIQHFVKKAQKQKAPLGPFAIPLMTSKVINPLHAARIRVLGRRSGSLLHSYPVPTWWWCGCRRPRGSLAPRAGGRAGRAP